MKNVFRKKVISGNWKMNYSPIESIEKIKNFLKIYKTSMCDIIIFAPAIDLYPLSKILNYSNIFLGAQNCHWEKSGAFTGEISSEMLTETGIKYVLIGHSERRIYFGETNETVNKRLKCALNSGLNAILCVGEGLGERESNITFEHLSIQIKLALLNISKEKITQKVIIAYEPLWAIGTGKTANANQANEVCSHIRCLIKELYDEQTAQQVIIQYGGSVNSKNILEILSKSDIDGCLVGGASLDPQEFTNIIKAADSI